MQLEWHTGPGMWSPEIVIRNRDAKVAAIFKNVSQKYFMGKK
jgi:hypothetical protein